MGTGERHRDLSEIALELRKASQEAKRAARLDPENGETLRRKADHLESAAARIEQEADKRTGFIAFADERS